MAMDTNREQRLRDEVIYLHSLWHQGPPSKPSSSNTKRLIGNGDSHAHQNKKKKNLSNPDPPSQSDSIRDQTKNPLSHRPETGDFAQQLQHKAAIAFREFFAGNSGSDGGSGNSEEEGNDYWVDDGDEKYQFFLRIFVEDGELRRYYEENSQNGEFYCLVCIGLRKRNLGKKFKNCVSLVQHSIGKSMDKKNEKAHRGFGQVVCRVLGWDFDQIPMIVSKGEPLGRSLGNFSLNHGVSEPNAGCSKNHSGVVSGNEGESNQKDGSDNLRNDGGKLITWEVSTAEWPCEKPIENFSSAVSGWPAFKPQSASPACLVSAEEQVRSAAIQVQHKALNACRDFFATNSDSDSDESENEDDCKDEDEDAAKESKEFNFFLKLFMEDSNLRDFYVKNYKGGEFCCLVCGGIRKKVWKRFPGSVALVQHSTATLKTNKKLAHRAYGQVICQVLGWDFNRLPSIVLKGETLGQPVANLGSSQLITQDESEKNAASPQNYVHSNDDTSIIREVPVCDESLAMSGELQVEAGASSDSVGPKPS